ncbi:MAG: hypothetical protein ABEI27_03715 [Halobellus sp.]|uniref:hypothetical protein n=1 Tax=Halobellus sp. TaxID=1979212 RepID=UPI0035D50B55
MPRVVLLNCPICEAVRAVTGTRWDLSEDQLRSTAKTHLLDHELNESKAAIHKYRVIEEAVELILPKDDVEELPEAAWRSPTAMGLPAEAVSDEDAGAQLP